TNQITEHFMNITKFFLANVNGLDAVDKVVALSIGGFDTHAYQNVGLPSLISSIAGGLHGMFRTILELRPDLYDCLTVVTLSEFGRSLRQDSGNFLTVGSDHGWMSNYLILAGRTNPVDNNVLDTEFGPHLTTTDDPNFEDNVDAILGRYSNDYAADLSVSHLNINVRHGYPKVSAHSAIMALLKRALNLTDSQVEAVMEPVFFEKNIFNPDHRRLWTEVFSGLC
ncbi:MAG: DUF1501 domain-containing protein, partial [Thermoplasmatales archaeon]